MSIGLREPIILTPEERQIAKFIAKLRTKRNEKTQSTVTMGNSQFEVDLRGVGGELAFAKLCNIYPDFTTELRSGGEDCHFHNGLRVDVKTSNMSVAGLYVTVGKEEKADVFVWLRGEFPRYWFMGYTTPDKIIECPVYEKEFGDRVVASYYMSKDKLYDIGQTDHFTKSELS